MKTTFIEYLNDIMSSIPDDNDCAYCLRECAYFHLLNCFQHQFCFYNDMLNACFTALEMGWA